MSEALTEGILRSWTYCESLQTYTGKAVNPLALEADAIDILDIAHALSHLCRFNGHCRQFYSVAEHSVRMSRIVPRESGMWGLLHDAAEAYLVDLPRPVKLSRGLGELYKIAERRALQVIAQRFGLSWPEPAEFKYFDNVLLMTEQRDLMVRISEPRFDNASPLPERIEPWTPDAARAEFLARFAELTKGIGHKDL
jgi:hypothetical protein